jgi:hypothetical protein
MGLGIYQPVCGFQEELSEPMSAMSEEVSEIMIGKQERGRERKETKRDPSGIQLIGATNSANPPYRLLTSDHLLFTTTTNSILMAAPRPTRPKPLDWSAPSHLTVFVRNLKLLQLDQRKDWPDITLRSLSPSSQNQRQRVRLVEWALYYLCTIWDPENAQNVRYRSDIETHDPY